MIVPYRNALLIPQKATFEVLEKKYVFVVGDDHVIHQKEIEIAGEMPDLYIVKSGITKDDKIMLEGIRKVRDNDKIEKITYEDPQTVISHLNVYVE
jgi:membrane fusion protein (multidrug efflux system)